MRHYTVYILFLLFPALLVKSNEKLEKAAEAYDNKKYKEAIELYNQLISEGNVAYELYYNLGNAYYRNKELGYAIYNYELARKLNPNDEDIKINLGIASSKTIDKIDAHENYFISAIKSGIVNSLSTQAWAWFSVMFSFMCCASVFLFVSSKKPSGKRIGFFLTILFLSATVAFYLFGKTSLNSRMENKFAIILNREVKIINEPNKSGVLKFTLHEGTKVRIVEATGDWILIKLENGNEGWVKQSEVGII